MCRSAYTHTRWPSPAPDPAAAALAELVALLIDAGPGDWVQRGTCRDSRDDVHFPTGREDSPGYRLGAAIAKLECAGCPVLTECRAYALDVVDLEGIWGGTTPNDRTAIRRDRDQRRAS
jgi:WhiB family redox-sensing transcriptional regulator